MNNLNEIYLNIKYIVDKYSTKIEEEATNKIKIPMEGRAESLNAAVATGIIIYEAKRQINYNK